MFNCPDILGVEKLLRNTYTIMKKISHTIHGLLLFVIVHTQLFIECQIYNLLLCLICHFLQVVFHQRKLNSYLNCGGGRTLLIFLILLFFRRGLQRYLLYLTTGCFWMQWQRTLYFYTQNLLTHTRATIQ